MFLAAYLNNLKVATSTLTDAKQETDYSNNYFAEKTKNRNSFHQNVEEALSSLLWQPYEYQNQNNNEYNVGNNGNDYESSHYSTCSYTPSTSPISLDLDETFDNAATSPSNTKKSVPSSNSLQYSGTVPPPSRPPSLQHRKDLHSDVINLNRQEPSDQPGPVLRPRDSLLQRSGTGAFVSLPTLASSRLNVECAFETFSESATSCFGELSGEASMQGGSGSASAQHCKPSSALPGGSSDNGLKPMSIQPDSSLNAANIVGLPSSHARYPSVPCSGTAASFQNAHAASRPQTLGYPQHFRNISEPSQQILRYSTNGQVPPAVFLQNSGTSPQVEQQNLQLINHFRSSSVPKSMTLVSKYDVTASSGTPGSVRIKGPSVLQQTAMGYGAPLISSNNNVRVVPTKLPVRHGSNSPLKTQVSNLTSALNSGHISNVNVNFYRAVPVNVVSSVPTIHCLNTLSNDQGNSVSNVQVLPLGSGSHQSNAGGSVSVASYVTNVENQSVFNGRGDGVTVHNINPVRIDSINQVITTGLRGSSSTHVHGGASGTASRMPNFTNADTSMMKANVVSIQNGASSADAQPAGAGRVITTTAQINSAPNPNITRTRTFTSTEAQTDEILPALNSSGAATQHQPPSVREQRRRDRRERRQNRRPPNPPRSTNDSSTQAGGGQEPQENRLPDILNSHLPPPYSTLPTAQMASMAPPLPPQILPPPPAMIPGGMLPNPPGPVLQTVVPNGMPASAFVFPAPQQMAPLMQGGAPVPVAVPATGASGFRFGFPVNGFRR
uniref:Uncharacterized protein n=1 Tax=Dendroctonus ponderosae TaxID=77166 RepID=A0AAR5QA81_DENPD